MLLVLAEAGDPLARAVAALARDRGAPVVWLTPGDLVQASWWHHLDGEVVTRLVTADGRAVVLGEVAGVLNRLRWLPPGGLATAADRDYARAERHALATSALAALACPVVNPVRPPSLAGAERSPAAWLALAAPLAPTRQVRLTTDGRRWGPPEAAWEALGWASLAEVGAAPGPVAPVGRAPVAWAEPVGPVRAVTVVGGRCHGAPDEPWAQRCRRLAEVAGCPLLAVVLARPARPAGRGGWVVTGADPAPAGVPPAAVDDLVGLVAGR